MEYVLTKFKWKCGILREDIMGMKAGDLVFYKQTPYLHANQALGNTFWLTNEGRCLCQVSELLGGVGLRSLIYNHWSKDIDHDSLNKWLLANLQDSAYKPSNRKIHIKEWKLKE